VPLPDWLLGLFDSRPRAKDAPGRARGPLRGPVVHVVILDGTMSSLARGAETNAGQTFKLLREAGLRQGLTVYYEAGIQWRDWSGTLDVMLGRGINRQIERAYGVLASRWRPGDRIVLVGYSRGAYAVRSLAGVIGAVGLVRSRDATVRNIRQAYRHYREGGQSAAAADFARIYCHPGVQVEAVAVWDTVKALGLRLPILWRWAQDQHSFHNHALGPHVLHGFHALALDERREAYAPVLWESDPARPGVIEQVWFNGTHGDVGGQLDGVVAARPLANIPLVWLLDRLEMCAVPLPVGWRDRFVQDARAPSIGGWRGWAKIFLSRRRRVMGRDPSESLHPSVTRVVKGWPKARRAVPVAAEDPPGGIFLAR
jgi:hypothetical protein